MGRYNFLDFCRKVIFVGLRWVGHTVGYFRKLKFWFYTRAWPAHVQGAIHFTGICTNVHMGPDASFYRGAILEVAEQGHLSVGKSFTLSYGSLISCRDNIKIGDDVMIGEYVSIRDTTHSYNLGEIPYCRQNDVSQKIVIGNNVWIGRGSVILPGAFIEDGVVVGANSVVKGNCKAYCLYVGAPARMIKELK